MLMNTSIKLWSCTPCSLLPLPACVNSDEIPFLTEAEWQSYGYPLSLDEWRDALSAR